MTREPCVCISGVALGTAQTALGSCTQGYGLTCGKGADAKETSERKHKLEKWENLAGGSEAAGGHMLEARPSSPEAGTDASGAGDGFARHCPEVRSGRGATLEHTAPQFLGDTDAPTCWALRPFAGLGKRGGWESSPHSVQ